MKAAIYRQYGTPEEVVSIEDVETPKPRRGELLIKVHATTVNRTDCAIIKGSPFVMRFFTGLRKPKQIIPGTDFAGEIEAVGEGVTAFKIGDRVFGFHDMGIASQAEYLTISEKGDVVTIPDNITFQQAVASIEGGHYGINFINKVTIKPGDRIFVNGGTGAIGSALIQLLKQFDVTICSTATTESVARVKQSGVARVVDYTKSDFREVFHGEHFDFIFDAVGKSRYLYCKPLLKPKGIYISSELGPKGENIPLSLFTPLGGGKRVKFPMPTNIKGSLEQIRELLESGQFDPMIDRSYPLEEIKEAYRYVSSGKKIGNVLIAF